MKKFNQWLNDCKLTEGYVPHQRFDDIRKHIISMKPDWRVNVTWNINNLSKLGLGNQMEYSVDVSDYDHIEDTQEAAKQIIQDMLRKGAGAWIKPKEPEPDSLRFNISGGW